jgi:O-antigen/teichoic acid export membrane protein
MNNNKRIIKNTLFLYIRMIFTIGVNLYTSRLVLETLGIEDYGIYNIVAGVIVMFGFLNASMSGATSRFLTFELGKGNRKSLLKTFSASLTVHFIIAGIIFILGETFGLWWMNTKLVINPTKLYAAQWVYQFSIISAIFSIIQVPYNAMIVAHEKMNIYAYIEIFNSSLKLGIILLLNIINYDKLILYAFLILCASVFITIIYRICCIKIISPFKFNVKWNKEIILPMLQFSTWDLYGNMSVIAKTQGVNMLLNLFFGVLVNAAYGIANQVQCAVNSFSSNFLLAVRPQVMKYFASGEIEKMKSLMNNSSKFAFILMYLLELPFILECNFILHLWLKKVPEYALIFTQLNLIPSLIYTLCSPMVFAIHASGKIKGFSFITGTIYLSVIPFSYLFFKMGFSPIIPYILNIILMMILYIAVTLILQYLLPQLSYSVISLKNIILSLITVVLSSVILIYFHNCLSEGWIRFLLICFLSILLIPLLSYFILFDPYVRKKIIKLIMDKLIFFKNLLINKNI